VCASNGTVSSNLILSATESKSARMLHYINMNELNNASSLPPLAPRENIILSIVSLILSSIALVGPLLHAVLLAFLFAAQGPSTSESFGAFALGMGIIIFIEIFTLPFLGIPAVIMGIIAAAKGGRGRKLAIISLSVSALTLVLLIVQIVFWSSAGGTR
jgi:hypothetical protein